MYAHCDIFIGNLISIYIYRYMKNLRFINQTTYFLNYIALTYAVYVHAQIQNIQMYENHVENII